MISPARKPPAIKEAASDIKHFPANCLSALCSENIMVSLFSSFLRHLALHNIYQEIGLYQNLIIHSINMIICVMMGNQILNPIRYRLIKAKLCK